MCWCDWRTLRQQVRSELSKGRERRTFVNECESEREMGLELSGTHSKFVENRLVLSAQTFSFHCMTPSRLELSRGCHPHASTRTDGGAGIEEGARGGRFRASRPCRARACRCYCYCAGWCRDRVRNVICWLKPSIGRSPPLLVIGDRRSRRLPVSDG